MPLVFVLVPLKKFPIDFKIIQWKFPLKNLYGFALSKMKFQVWAAKQLCLSFVQIQDKLYGFALNFVVTVRLDQ